MLLDWAVSCSAYELHDNGTADIYGAGLDTFYVERLPTELDLTILIRLFLMEDDEGELELFFFAPLTRPIRRIRYLITPQPGPNHRAGFSVTQIEAIEVLDIPVKEEGVHSVEVYVNGSRGTVSGERRHSIYFNVREGQPN